MREHQTEAAKIGEITGTEVPNTEAATTAGTTREMTETDGPIFEGERPFFEKRYAGFALKIWLRIIRTPIL